MIYPCTQRDRTVEVTLFYPREPDNPNVVIVDLSDLRASDPVRLRYDFDRDGWVIEQPVWEDYLIKEWREVHFCKTGHFTP